MPGLTLRRQGAALGLHGGQCIVLNRAAWPSLDPASAIYGCMEDVSLQSAVTKGPFNSLHFRAKTASEHARLLLLAGTHLSWVPIRDKVLLSTQGAANKG